MNLTDKQLDALLAFAVDVAQDLRITTDPVEWVKGAIAAGEIPECPPDLLSRGAAPIDWAPLPSWVEWVAQDADGLWFGYERRPINGDTHWMASDGRCDFVPAICHNWRESLQQRPDAE